MTAVDARYDLWVNGATSHIEEYLVWPGWFTTVFLGAAHAGELGGGWDYVVVFLVGGVIWGTLLFTVFGLAKFLTRKPAA